jgi:chromodomain-helicase-DNA-binding protein 7
MIAKPKPQRKFVKRPPQHEIQALIKKLESEVKFPLTLTKGTELLSLGSIVADRPKFHCSRYVYPAGYRCSRLYSSISNPSERVRWICEILDTGGDAPNFRIYMESSPEQVWEGNSPTAPWSIVLREIARITNTKSSISGPEAFMLTSPIVEYLINKLPGIELLEGYTGKPE